MFRGSAMNHGAPGITAGHQRQDASLGIRMDDFTLEVGTPPFGKNGGSVWMIINP